MTGFDLPLIKRELLQRSQRRRTYAMRCLVLFVLSFIFMIPMIALRNRNMQFLMGSLGHGRDLVTVIFVTLGCILYALGPAMSCGAISSEKERQTLSLLLVSRLSASTIILEKLAAQLIPLLVFLTLSVPLLAVSYLFGGISFDGVAGGFLLLCMLAAHIVAISVFWSALLPSSLAAFWATYGTLFITSFGMILAREAAKEVGPIFGDLFDLLLTPLAIFLDDSTGRTLILFPMYHVISVTTGPVWSILVAVIPFNLLTVIALGSARWALVKYGEADCFSLRRVLSNMFSGASGSSTATVTSDATDRLQPAATRKPGRRAMPILNSIAWRETRQLQTYRKFYLVAMAIVVLWSWMLFWNSGMGTGRRDIEVSAVFVICF